jgi:hypothetical protein
MTSPTAELRSSSGSGGATVVQAVTVIMGVVVGLTFLFGFGNVLNLALRLGVPAWVSPLVAPAVDLSILGLLLGIRHLALAGATPMQLRPARRLLIFASAVTLALNVADPLVAGQYGKAAFDAVGPLLLIGWAEVGPDLLRALTSASRLDDPTVDNATSPQAPCEGELIVATEAGEMASEMSGDHAEPAEPPAGGQSRFPASNVLDDLLERARAQDKHHWEATGRPISADTLRRKLRIGAARSRLLVAIIRADARQRSTQVKVSADVGG